MLTLSFFQEYIKKMAKSLHIVDDMSKRVRNFDILDYKKKRDLWIMAKISVLSSEITTLKLNENDYISITDIAKYNDEISKFVLFMNTFPVYKAEIGGHTDNVGDATANKKLSSSRANSVKERFTKEGVEAGRMTAIGYGEEQPIASNDTVEGRDENRRIEVTLSK